VAPPFGSVDPRGYVEAQAKFARSPELAERVVRVAGIPGNSARKFLRHSSAKPEADADGLQLPVTLRSGAAAVRLSNVYAAEFRHYTHERDTRAIRAMLHEIESAISRLRAQVPGRIRGV
jgi:hypothetical protein